MKELVLLRHAKSDWDDLSLSDHDRPLSARGRRAAPSIAEWLVANDAVPDRVLCSTSRRTRETWALLDGVFDASGIRASVDYFEDLYLGSPRTLINRVRESSEKADRVMLLAHNPGTHELAIALAGSGDDAVLDRLDYKFPTCAVARFEIDIDRWAKLTPGIGKLLNFVRPRDLLDASGPAL